MGENLNSQQPETEPLPEGYHFVGQEDLSIEEIIDLREAVGWEGRDPKRWQQNLDLSLAVVGVKSDQEELVGIGFVAGNAWHAVLCDFDVHPDHQRQGIGTAILDRRMRIIEERDIWYVYCQVAETNTLRERYINKYGFQANGGSIFLDRTLAKT